MTASVRSAGDYAITWGESVRWDDRRGRLYFVDCAAQTLHWLDGDDPTLQTLALGSLPTGVALTQGTELLVCLDAGLHVVDPDAGSVELLAPYPEEMHGRANDANADGHGNLVTGTLNLAPGPGGFWWFSIHDGWQLLDEPIGNANGPVVAEVDGRETLVFADTLAQVVYAYDYDGDRGTVGERRVFADADVLGGPPDGATADGEGAVWTCVLHLGRLVRFVDGEVERVVEVGVPNPSDAGFAGPSLDRLYVTTITLDIGGGAPEPGSPAVLLVDGIGVTGRPEPRFDLGR